MLSAGPSNGSVEKVYHILKRYKNEGKLRGSVHGPLAAELTCSSRQDIVENCIGGRYLLAFVFTDKRDLDLLYRDHRQHARKIAYLLNETIHIPPRTFNPNVNGIALKFADQLLVEPKREVLSALCSSTGISNTLVGDRNAQREIDNHNNPLLKALCPRVTDGKRRKGFVLFTDKFRHQISYSSMFPGETAEQSQQFGVNGDRYGLTKRVDIERYNSEKKKLLEKQRSVEQINDKIKAIVAEIAPVTNKRKDLVLEQESILFENKAKKEG